MRKQELVHLHGLLAEVLDYCEEPGALDVDLPEYRALETRPTSINRSKAAHSEAVFVLAEALATGLDGADDRAEPASTTE